MNRQPPSISARNVAGASSAAHAAAAAIAATASYSPAATTSTPTSADIGGGGSGGSGTRSSRASKKKKRLRPQKHISRWSEALFGGGAAASQEKSLLDSIDEGFEGESSSSSFGSGSGDGSDDTVQRSGHSKRSQEDDCDDSDEAGGACASRGGGHGKPNSPVHRGRPRPGPLHHSLPAQLESSDKIAAAAAAAAETSTRSLDYISAAAATKPSAAAAATAPYNQASNATLQTAASTAYHEQSQSTFVSTSGAAGKSGSSTAAAAAAAAAAAGVLVEEREDWIEPLRSETTAAAASGPYRGGGHRRSSNSSGSGTGPAAAGGRRNRSRLHSIPDDIEVSDDQMLQHEFQQSALSMRGALSASSGDESDNIIERKVAAALSNSEDTDITSSGDDAAAARAAVSAAATAPTRQKSAIEIAMGAAPDSSASAPQSANDIALAAAPAHRSSSFTRSVPIKDAKPQARSSSLPLIDDDDNDDLDIENMIMLRSSMQAADNNTGVGMGMGAQTSSSVSAGIIPPLAGTLMTGRLNDSVNSLGTGRATRRASDASNAESIAASSIAAASWMGSMGDSDLSGSSSDCEGDGPSRQRLRTRRRRKHRRPTTGRRVSNGSDDGGSAPVIVVEGGAGVQSGRRRRRTSWRRHHLPDSAPAGAAATYRDRRSSDPICSHEVARAIADLDADVSDLNSDSSSDDGNGYEKAPGSRLDAIVASLRAVTANNGNAQRNTTNQSQSPRDLNDLFRPNRVLRSTAPREPNSSATNAAALHSSWPNRASASMPTLSNQTSHVAAAAAGPSVETIGISAASNITGTGIRRQDESFANVEDLIRASLRTQPSSVSPRSQQGGDIHGSERSAQSWPIVSSHRRDDIASAAAVGVAVGARRSNNRSDSIIDTLQNLDLRQHLRDHDSASTFNFIDVDEAGTNDTTTTTTAAGSGAGAGSLQTNPLMAERQAILGFGQERRRPGDSGHRISNSRPSPNSRSGINSRPSTANLPPRESSGPIRGIDALGAAIGAIAAAAPDRPPPRSNSVISASFSHRTSSMSTDTHRSSMTSVGGGDGSDVAPSTRTPAPASSGAAETTPITRAPPAAPAAAAAPTANVRRRHSGPTPLYEAVASGSSYDTIKSLIDLDPSSTGHQNGAGLTPLHTAIERYDVPMSIIRLLLASNPSTASMPRTDARTPLDLLWKRYVDPDSFRIQSSIVAANQLATLMEMAVSDDGCNRPPSSQSGSEEDVGVEENSGKPRGLSKRDMDRKSRAMRILLSSPRLRDFWDLMTLFVRAAHHGTIADPLPPDHGRWRIVHSCVVTRCEPLLIRFAAALYPEQLRERDEQTGWLPLHITSALSCERSANSIDKTVLRLWPRGAWGHDNEGRLAISLAIEAGKPWRFVRALLLCAPPSLLTRDTKTQMMPFMVAAASPHASLDCSYRLLRDSVDIIMTNCDGSSDDTGRSTGTSGKIVE